MAEPMNGNTSFLEQWMRPVSCQLKDTRLEYAFDQFNWDSGSNSPQPLASDLRNSLHPEGDWHLAVVSHAAGEMPVKLGELKVYCQIDQMPALPAVAKLMQQHGLVADFRFGRLWVTTPQAAQHWRDTTGVSAIRPPRGSSLARAWECEVPAQIFETSLDDAVLYLEGQCLNHGCRPQVDFKATSSIPITARASGQLRHALGIVLERARCRCRLHGETLVIEDLPVTSP